MPRRLLVVSDIHGEKTKFLALLKRAGYDSCRDRLVVCGDMIDRGTENAAALSLCRQLRAEGAVLLKGNHEQMAAGCLPDMIAGRPSEAARLWVNYNGGANTYDEIKDWPIDKLQRLQHFFASLPAYFAHGKYIFAHAGVNPAKPVADNDEDELIWERRSFYFQPCYEGKTVVFGHVPTWLLASCFSLSTGEHSQACIWRDPINDDKIGIDCGSIFGGRLAALELPSGQAFYV